MYNILQALFEEKIGSFTSLRKDIRNYPISKCVDS